MSDIVRCTGLDLETTGLKVEKGEKIVEFAFSIYDFDKITKKFTHRKDITSLVNPGKAIPQASIDIHHISPEMVASKPIFSHFAPIISKILATTDILIAHNMSFDGPFLHYEMMQVKAPFNQECEPFCTMDNGRFATALGGIPTLAKLCWALDVEFDTDGAHRADYDTNRMMQAFVKGVEQGFFAPDKIKPYL